MGGRVVVAATDGSLRLLPPRPGTYVLALHLPAPISIPVGRLGTFDFPPGFYLYVGSARGPGGLAGRIARHLRHPKPLRWHVDFLRAHARPVAVWWAEGEERAECAWAHALARMPGGTVPVPRFGASDCRCPAHLFLFSSLPDRERIAQAIGTSVEEVRFDR